MNRAAAGITVLIVQDEAIIAADLEFMLRRLGYAAVGTATSGEEAIRKAGELRPHVILMDVQLQGSISGIEAAHQIRANQNAAVVYVTALNRIAAANLRPGYRCIGKPFTPGDLRAAIEAALPEVSGRASASA
ncbi:MAG TPA: response regulator [Bryobacteraceae bacterium]|nr:response regulator [Bryobacteraceae bacterium]